MKEEEKEEVEAGLGLGPGLVSTPDRGLAQDGRT